MARKKRKPQPKRGKWEPMLKAKPVPMPKSNIEQVKRMMGDKQGTDLIDELANIEMWMNNHYVVQVTRRDDGSVMELSIRRQDRGHAHDWRDFQRIKTEIAGAETEAFELYPAESRLMDTANQFYLFCLPPGERIPAGYNGPRLVTELPVGKSKQRPVPDDWKHDHTASLNGNDQSDDGDDKDSEAEGSHDDGG